MKESRHFVIEFDVEDLPLSPSELEQITTRDFRDFLGKGAENLTVTVSKIVDER